MNKKPSILILIPARGGSTRVKNKNLRLLSNRPLLSWVVEAATKVLEARVVVSTDSDEIARAAQDYGAEVPFKRPTDLASAHASSLSAILNTLEWMKKNNEAIPEFLAFCPPTNPFVRSETIQEMLALLSSRPDRNSIVTVASPSTHPFKIVKLHGDGTLENGVISIDGKTINDIERSQDWPKVWEGSPACRMTRTRFFLELLEKYDAATAPGKTYDPSSSLGHPISGLEAFDIDTEEDLALAETLLLQAKSSERP